MPSAKILEKKKELVKDLSEKLKKAKMVVLSEYRGINVSDDTKLRGDLRKENNEYVVAKNSIISHAAKEAGIEGLDAVLEGPTSVVIGYDDYIAPAKTINDYAKTHDFYKIKAGIMDGKVISNVEVTKLATLPSKDTLYAMLASALLGNIRNLAVVLDQTREKKENASA
ncbi:MAG: 50S ribosomal protein L10 [Clostridia bacterium]|nr:50S ribosomal protein L10 [Clostridia bacterium]